MANIKLRRDQLATFLTSHEMIKKFENLISVVDETDPTGNLASQAQEISDALQQISDTALNYVTSMPIEVTNDTSPPAKEGEIFDDVSPVPHIGTLGHQNADNVSVTGGNITATITDDSSDLISSSQFLTNHSAANAGTLNNAPVGGNPTKWVAINDNGTVRYIPTW